jgi:hypothetical protein
MFKLDGDKACIDIFTLLHDYVPEDRKQELAESLSCADAVINNVVDQLLDGSTEHGFSGSEYCPGNVPESLSPLQKARRRIAEQSGEVAAKEIARLQRLVNSQTKRADEYAEKYFELYHREH